MIEIVSGVVGVVVIVAALALCAKKKNKAQTALNMNYLEEIPVDPGKFQIVLTNDTPVYYRY